MDSKTQTMALAEIDSKKTKGDDEKMTEKTLMSEIKEARDDLMKVCEKILELLDDIQKKQKLMVENQAEIFKQMGGELEP